MPIPEIFSRRGELWFRRTEERVIRDVLSGEPGVLALGGGARGERPHPRPAAPHRRRRVAQGQPGVAWARVKDSDRPLATDEARFARRLARARAELPRGGAPGGRRGRPGRRGGGARRGVGRAGGRRGRPVNASAPAPTLWAEVGDGPLPGPPGARAAAPHRRDLGGAGAAPPSCSSATATCPRWRGAPARRCRRAGLRVISASVPPGEGVQVARAARAAHAPGGRGRAAPRGRGRGARRRGRRRPRRLRGRQLPARHPPGPRADDAARDGRLGHRRQDRRSTCPEGKNYVGAIWQPDLVVMDTDRWPPCRPASWPAASPRSSSTACWRAASCSGTSRSWPALPGPPGRAGTSSSAAACRTSCEWSRRTSATTGCARPSTWATPWATASRPPPGTAATATARRSRWGCWRPCACRSRASGSTTGVRAQAAEVLARHDLPTRLAPEVPTPAILEAMGRDKKAAAGRAQHGAAGGARRRAPEASPAGRPPGGGDRGAAPAERASLRIALLHGPEPRPCSGAGRPRTTARSPFASWRTGSAAWGAERGMAVAASRPTTRARSWSTSTALAGAVDGAVVNPGAWTHYQWSIRDALELLGAPFVEVHLSDVEAREPHRRYPWCATSRPPPCGGSGPDGYRDALDRLRELLA